MIKLPFECYCTELKVNPKNWQTPRCTLKKDWFVFYRFYDPTYRENTKFKKGKLVILKGMNQFKTIPDRQTETKKIIERELGKLKNEAYNPITSKTLISIAPLLDIEPLTPFIKAFSLAEQRISASVSTKRDLRSTLKFVTSAAMQLRYSELPVNNIGRKHIKQLLSHIDICNGESPHRYNKIRSYLMMIYKELIELEVVEVNPLRDLSKKKVIQRIRKLPSNENGQIINEYLQLDQYSFWLFMQIFFHSGARLTEMMNVKRNQVNLEEQYFIITIKKGRVYKEVKRPIKNIALHYWKKAIEPAKANDFIFSKGLLPGTSPIVEGIQEAGPFRKEVMEYLKKKYRV